MAGDEDTNIGKQIGNYRIVEEIGSGAFADVYKGQHIVLRDKPPVAIKLLHARLKLPRERDTFIQEAQLLYRLQHPHILSMQDVGFQEGLPYIIAEYASRGSLQDRLDRQPGKPLPIDEAITILTHIGQALHYAHQLGIVHRDLKPENILFNAKGEALLADFGIAVVLASKHTKEVGNGGTPAYMAPEMFAGKVSTKSDQYALGCIAYELFTGRKPFDVEGVFIEAVWFQHAKVEPDAPTQHNKQIPTYIEQAILKAMAKERTERHKDVVSFIEALKGPQKTAKEWLKEGAALFKAGQYEEALAAYEQAIQLKPNVAYAYNNKGVILGKLKRYEEELSAYELAIRLAPNYARAYNNKGVVLAGLKRFEEALVAYEQAIQLNPSFAHPYYGKGIVLEQFGKQVEAQQAYAKARELGLQW